MGQKVTLSITVEEGEIPLEMVVEDLNTTFDEIVTSFLALRGFDA